ncbi:MAG TPA: SDR family oxidoreductase [Candidatus Binatia bacterium]|nr:SDR family oxidoreductase [Candidatus Binatia bacterium]
MPKRKILVAGASGLVGFAAVKHFAQLPGWEVVGVSRRIPAGLEGATLLSVDLSDRARCAEVFVQMLDVTHVVYAALYEKPGLVQGWRERDQMETNLAMLQNLFEPLAAVAKDLQHVTLLQGTKAYGAHIAPFPVPARERWPRHQHENFYWLQEDYLREKQQGKRWHWTILRPQVIFGESLGSNMNAIPAIGVYAALRREAGLPLSFPGGAPWLTEAVDADLLARACEWAATTSACENEAFNITNGDVFVWQNVWPTIADALGMEVGLPEPLSLAQEMPKREAEWAAIVRKYNLRAPTSLHEFVGQSFIMADLVFAYGTPQLPPAMLVSTIKARQAGFHDCMDTEDMFRKWFRRFQELQLLPPV